MKRAENRNKALDYEVILLGAGQGKRMGASRNKILLHLIGKPVISYSLNTFLNDPACKHIILVTQEDEQDLLAAVVKKENKKKHPITIVSGGSERQYSVFNGLKALLDPKNIVMVHDGARPFVSLAQLKLLHRKVQETRAAILGVPVKDTIKRVVDGIVEETVPRETLWQVQTPQAFYGADLLAVHVWAQQEDYLGTDDASLIEKYSDLPVSMVLGSYENIKLTTPEDMLIGEAIVKRRRN
ncbi:2-C-methyl-D-erythritol 4-phosphate cytidylyltransferase [Enterococcus sp. 7E2_DIV0204]|uniref:2-C-methyl-D-erythritol 4-phosphate cytidylyltransferase n=1 Tax=Candidatus Enterococcus lemimoniae TaxID=1834167 RepID=A0ABZ2T6P8_9ENTE|nr:MULTISPECIES: 2-C-methyl-D-erythritol 4-phosphate cytidylyltransferase [unclassified Enterococcus]OTN88878.1 2-C-methyl-D-erythritol 4-phosphate cytidylyltransferase [Enterococcus sp. 7E2_DIV0204]OTO71047.1 2-C-methyl-D-erythritol 4-phosphate cytidylyltransferase [Enterococcus sp. 12C11_DIV0727]OTP51344.1 2-C-methyl-D-erythritol 4-phosphate cytidylyltransferase [Enterococcus sp. 7D2_DIV0200]